MKKRIIFMWIFFGLSVVINVFIIFQSCLPQSVSSIWSENTVKVVENITQQGVNTNTVVNVPFSGEVTLNEGLRKIVGHFALFGLDGFLTFIFFFLLSLNKKVKIFRSLIFTFVCGFLISVVAEIIQIFVPGRAGSVTDMALNFIGFVSFALATSFIIYLFLLLKSRRKLNKKIN